MVYNMNNAKVYTVNANLVCYFFLSKKIPTTSKNILQLRKELADFLQCTLKIYIGKNKMITFY